MTQNQEVAKTLKRHYVNNLGELKDPKPLSGITSKHVWDWLTSRITNNLAFYSKEYFIKTKEKIFIDSIRAKKDKNQLDNHLSVAQITDIATLIVVEYLPKKHTKDLISLVQSFNIKNNNEDADAIEVLQQSGFMVILDASKIVDIIIDVCKNNKKAVGNILNNKKKDKNCTFLVGQVMKSSNFRIIPDLAREYIELFLTKLSKGNYEHKQKED